MRFNAAVSHEHPWYVARCLEVEVTSQGDSFDEALANLCGALELYFEDQLMLDLSVDRRHAEAELGDVLGLNFPALISMTTERGP